MAGVSMRKLKKIFWFALAALFLFEAWLWDHLGAALRRVMAFAPIQLIRAPFEKFVLGLSPWASLCVFAIPLIVLTPFKLAGLYFLAHHHVIAGVGCFLGAKLVGFSFGAYLFDLTQPSLLTIPLFAKGFAALSRWRALAHDLVAPYRLLLRAKLAPVRALLLKMTETSKRPFVARLRARAQRRAQQGFRL